MKARIYKTEDGQWKADAYYIQASATIIPKRPIGTFNTEKQAISAAKEWGRINNKKSISEESWIDI
jgi:hypothetical protein